MGWLAFGLVAGSLFFYNADEAIERRDELGDERFRVQGTPIEGSIVDSFLEDQPAIFFSIGFEGAVIDVAHVGDPRELFQAGVPVVLEGAWVQGRVAVPGDDDVVGFAPDGWYFESDRMLVKHDNDYINTDEYDQRIGEAERGGLSEGADTELVP